MHHIIPSPKGTHVDVTPVRTSPLTPETSVAMQSLTTEQMEALVELALEQQQNREKQR